MTNSIAVALLAALKIVLLSQVSTTAAIAVAASDGVAARGNLSALVSYDCKGSSLCGRSIGAADCPAAFNRIIPGDLYSTGGAAGNTGVCDGHCGIFVQGSGCSVTGTQLRNGFTNIRAHGCNICGSEHEDNGCLITINYVSGC